MSLIEQAWDLLAQGRKLEAAKVFQAMGQEPRVLAGLAVALLAESDLAQALELIEARKAKKKARRRKSK